VDHSVASIKSSVPEGDAGVQGDNSDLTCLGGVGLAHPSDSKPTFLVAVGKGNDAAGRELDLEAVQ
jgi:hypothetical protein